MLCLNAKECSIMNETKKRIKAYKAALPELRERVVAVALLLCMSLAMVTSATFAWLTISKAPQLSGVNTTVAANGSLEIALVKPDGSQPEESKIGDSSAASGQSVVGSNVTWGNLVNLSDESYGLENLTLRPAQLNQSALLTSPLFGAVYNEDGRIEKLSSSFAYTTWQPPEGNVEGYFLVTDDYGIRAISSTTVEAVGFAQQVLEKRDAAETVNLQAGSDYIVITQNRAWMNSLSAIMGTYMTARLNSSNPSMDNEDIVNARDMFAAFIEVYEIQIEAMVNLANYQLFLLHNSEEGSTPYTNYTAQTLLATTEANLTKEGIQLTGLNKLKTDYANLQSSYEELVVLADAGSVTYNDISDIVSALVNVGTCTISGSNMSTTTINSLAGDKSNAISAVTNGGINAAQITNGVLYNFEYLNGAHCKVEDLNISATYIITLNLTVDITTTAPSPSQFSANLAYADSLNQGAKGVEIAQDTYGLAIDLWVRTNAANSYLTLEGNVLTTTEVVDATTTDSNGNTVYVYTLPVTDDEGNSYTEEIYQMESDGETHWYYANTHTQVADELLENVIPIQKKDEIVTVVGFEGENRIWEDNSMLSVNSTTQGSGSCYVYYADTPEDQARSLVLLEAMNVAFVDDTGVLLATAVMDTDHYYAENGRVTVPLILSNDSISLGLDSSGNEIRAITALEQNVAKRITAIVYLDGTVLGNKDVLAASDIQGKLNIQLGSTQELVHAEDEALMNATRSVSATLSNTSFVYDQALESGMPMTTTVTIRVDGDAPKNVSAFFLRAISSTQGSRESAISDFVDNGDGTWTGTYTFTAPGNYVLRSVDLDGTTYDLAQPQTVTIEGFTVESLSCSQADTNGHMSIMTASSTSAVDLRLKFASDNVEAMPSTVQGRYLRSDGTAVNINFTYNATTGYWEGQAKFVTSGDYTLQYLVLDGEYTELESVMWQTASVYLGMKVAVYTDSPVTFLYEGSSMEDNKQNLYMKVKIMDNTGAEMRALTGATLYYSMQGSSISTKGMSAPLTWNASTGYYECTFQSKVGMYNFSNVTVGENTISAATTSPSFKILSPTPPTFNSGNTASYQYAPNNNAVLSVLINDCEAATVWADIVDANGTAYSVEGYLNNNGSWVFDVPKNAEGKQDGVWTIQQLRLWDVYDDNGNLYTEESPLVFDLTGKANVTAKVVSTVHVTVTPVADSELGKDSTGVTGKFMDSYTLSGLNVVISDFEGQAIEGISNVTLAYTYGNDSSTYGGYTSTSLTNAVADFSMTLVADAAGTKFTQSTDVSVLYAGSYTPSLSYVINGKTYTADASAVKFTISSVPASVAITAISPTGTFDVDTSGSGSGHTSNASPTWNSTSATVYFKCTRSGEGTTCSPYRHNYSRPSVTITLSGIGNATQADLTFGTNVQIYNGTTQTTGYSWTSNTTCVRNIGYYRSVTASSDDKTAAGTLTCSTLVLTYGGNAYNFAIPTITISNPY